MNKTRNLAENREMVILELKNTMNKMKNKHNRNHEQQT